MKERKSNGFEDIISKTSEEMKFKNRILASSQACGFYVSFAAAPSFYLVISGPAGQMAAFIFQGGGHAC